MTEQLIDEIISQLYEKIPEDMIQIVYKTLCISFNDYNIEKKETSLTQYIGFIPESYKAFMVTKKLEGKSDKTLSLYKLYLEDMFNTLKLPIKEITPNILKVYLYKTQQERKISNRSLDSRRSALHSFFSWATAEGYLDKNPMLNIKPIAYERIQQQPLTDMELELIREACKDIREKAIIEFFYSTGCRVTEMERLNKADINFSTGEVILFGKGNKHRISYLTAKASLLLQQYLDSRTDKNEALFVYKKSPYSRLKKAGIEKIVNEIGNRAGVSRLHPHLIRHTTATNALQHGMDITQVQQLLGHANIETTMIYAKADNTDIQRNHKKYLT